MNKVLLITFTIFVTIQSWANPICADYITKTCPQSSSFTNCDDQLIKLYTGNLYLPLNGYLRGLNSDIDCRPLADSLKQALLKLPPVNKATVFRGNKYIDALKNLKINEHYFDKAFVSTSKELGTASYYFAPNDDYVLFQIESTTGRDISKYAYGYEEEILLLPNTCLRLNGLSSYNGKKLYMFIEVDQHFCKI